MSLQRRRIFATNVGVVVDVVGVVPGANVVVTVVVVTVVVVVVDDGFGASPAANDDACTIVGAVEEEDEVVAAMEVVALSRLTLAPDWSGRALVADWLSWSRLTSPL